MVKFLSRLISYGASVAVIFHALNPLSSVVSYFDNLYLLYNVLGTIGFLVSMLIIFVLAVGNSKMSDSKVLGKDEEKFKKAMDSFEAEMKKNRMGLFINSVFGIGCGLTAFIVLSEHYMGFLMMSSVFVVSMVRSQIKDLDNKVKEKNA